MPGTDLRAQHYVTQIMTQVSYLVPEDQPERDTQQTLVSKCALLHYVLDADDHWQQGTYNGQLDMNRSLNGR